MTYHTLINSVGLAQVIIQKYLPIFISDLYLDSFWAVTVSLKDKVVVTFTSYRIISHILQNVSCRKQKEMLIIAYF
jgi:hypothetical protein